MTAPQPIPRRLVFRAIVDAMNGQALRLRDRLAGGVNPKRGQPPAPSKIAGRIAQIDRLESQAARIANWLSDDVMCDGPGFDAAVVGYLIAIAYSHMDAFRELRAELSDLGLPVPPEQFADVFTLLVFLIRRKD